MECGPSSARVVRPAVCGLGIGGGSASAVVDVCVATHMRGLVPHDHPQACISWTRATVPSAFVKDHAISSGVITRFPTCDRGPQRRDGVAVGAHSVAVAVDGEDGGVV